MDVKPIDIIKKAINIEVEHKYIDIRGKEKCFSKFIVDRLKELYKISKKDVKWRVLIEQFELYPTDSLENRRKAVKKLISVINDNENKNKLIESNCQNIDLKNLDIKFLKGVGPKLAYLYYKLDILTVWDLLSYYPKKYLDYTQIKNIKDLILEEFVTICGWVKSFSMFTSKKGLTIVKVVISDQTGSIILNYFFKKNNEYLKNKYRNEFQKNTKIIVSGKVKLDEYNGKYTLDNAIYEFCNIESNNNVKGIIQPVYALIEGLNSIYLTKNIKAALELYINKIDNILPEFIIKKYNLYNRQEALIQIHNPDNSEKLEKARKTLIFEELFLLELKIALLREEYNKNTSEKFEYRENGLIDKFIKSLPFELTKSQKKAANEIISDLAKQKPMQRLLEGDVGSGKTVVACIMVLMAIENGYQTAIMAPTEILARQHYNNFIKWLLPLNINVGLFIGSNKAKIKKELNQNLINGQLHVAIGTHALIQDDVEFQNLGAIIIDEQHRFGVNQRGKLCKKGKAPHMLSMSATPIPRSLALTINGDLDITIIDELPVGRKPIKTNLIQGFQKNKAFNLIRSELEKKHQAYIVYPLIDESETLLAKAIETEAEILKTEIFPDYNIGILHGKLPNEEKEQIMKDFKDKKFDILVATTVVEVGVDVENATVIMIENAERFGLAQLHQLRGRVGRCDKQSYCILISNTRNEDTINRLNVMEQTNDGFIIAQKDLQIRGPGEYLGTKQSGVEKLLIANIVRDIEILEKAKIEAFEFVKHNDINDFPNLISILNNKDIKTKIS